MPVVLGVLVALCEVVALGVLVLLGVLVVACVRVGPAKAGKRPTRLVG